MLPLSLRLAPSRFLDPALLLVVAIGVTLWFALRAPPAETPARRRARWAAWIAWAGLWASSSPLVGDALVYATEIRGPDLSVALAGKDREKVALLVLGGGVRTTVELPTPRERLAAASAQRAITAARPLG